MVRVWKQGPGRGRAGIAWLVVVGAGGVWALVRGAFPADAALPPPPAESYVVIGYNDLGMHCMGNRFAEICILPPANTMRATVIKRGSSPDIITSDVVVSYSIPGNTVSHTKTDFWTYAPALFGVNLPNDMGLFGYGMSGNMTRMPAEHDYMAAAIPNTPIKDNGVLDPYQLALITAKLNGVTVATTQATIPVSWEMHCDECHKPTSKLTVEGNILTKHDKMHKTNLMSQRPVLCASCHADPALGAPGKPGISNLSSAMHLAHAGRFRDATTDDGKKSAKDNCYSCHPGTQTQCLRDVHAAKGMDCYSCHGSMKDVGNKTRTPWVSLPRCADCHHVQGHEYEQPGVRFRDSFGHGGVKCEVCHSSPHAIVPVIRGTDNVQYQNLQGYPGTLNKCTVCHTSQPEHAFFHKRDDD